MSQLYDELHGVGNAPMTLSEREVNAKTYDQADLLVQVTFGAASVFLLKEVGNGSADDPSESQLRNIDDCVGDGAPHIPVLIQMTDRYHAKARPVTFYP